MHDITKVKVGNESECSYKNFPANREFKKRASDDVDLEIFVNGYSQEKITAENMKITEGSVEGVVAKLAVGVVPKVVIKYMRSSSPYPVTSVSGMITISPYGESIYIDYVTIGGGALYVHTVLLRMDGTYAYAKNPRMVAFESSV